MARGDTFLISEQDAEQIEQDLLDWVSEEPIHKRRVDRIIHILSYINWKCTPEVWDHFYHANGKWIGWINQLIDPPPEEEPWWSDEPFTPELAREAVISATHEALRMRKN
jgi:hypothetical protein